MTTSAVDIIESEDNVTDLPKGWRWSRLVDICEFNPRRPSFNREDTTLTTFVQMSAVDEESGTIVRPEQRPFGAVKKGYTYFAEGDVLFAKITPCMQNGKHAIAQNLIDGIGFGSTEFHVIRPGPQVIAEWIHYFVRQPWVMQEAIAHFSGSVGQQRVPASYLENLHIPLPSVLEQKRIVVKLKEKIAAVAQAEKAAEVRGKAASLMISAKLRALFNQRDLISCRKVNLGEICRDISDGTHFTPQYTISGVPFLSVKDIREHAISFDACKYISEEEHKRLIRRCKPEIGDVLYTKVGTTGIAKTVDVDREFSIFVSVALLKPSSEVTANYLETVLNAYIGKTQAASLTQGMANRNLVLQDIKKIEIPLPKIELQVKVANAAKQIRHDVNILSSALIEQHNAIHSLCAALARQAFNGEFR